MKIEAGEAAANLRRPDLGGVVRQRSPGTKRDYKARCEGWIKRLSRSRQEPVGIVDLVDELCRKAPSIKPNTYFQYRAVLLQELEDGVVNGDMTLEQAKALVARMQPKEGVVVGVSAPAGRTSSDRLKHISEAGVAVVRTVANARGGRTYRNLADIFEYAIKVGSRPCELFGARLEGRTLIMRSAKFSPGNDRGLGHDREIILEDDFDDFDLNGLSELLYRLDIELAEVQGDRSRLVRRYGEALRVLRSELSNDVPWAATLTLRTTRSQFHANIKRAGFTAAEAAAAMGHGSAETGASNYGRTNKGWTPLPGNQPIAVPQTAVVQVRVGARTKAKLARGQPTKLTEFRSRRRRRSSI